MKSLFVFPGPGMLPRMESGPDGLNPLDPGMVSLSKALARPGARSGQSLLLLHCGSLCDDHGSLDRAILDVREAPLDPSDVTVGSQERATGTTRFWPATADALCGPLTRNDFDDVVLWPRAHLGMDFSVSCIAEAVQRCRVGGAIWLSTRKDKGGDRLQKTLRTLAGADLVRVDRAQGSTLVYAKRNEQIDQAGILEALGLRYELTDPALLDLRLSSAPGVFSRRSLDEGTRVLLEFLSSRWSTFPSRARVLDLGAGVGPLTLVAARQLREGRIFAIDSNLRAIDLLKHNASQAGLADRVHALALDAAQPGAVDAALRARAAPAPARTRSHRSEGSLDLVLANPPTHAPPEVLTAMLQASVASLSPNGRCFVVVNREGRALSALQSSGLGVTTHDGGNFVVLEGRRAT